MLQELAKNHAQWLKMAERITKNSEDAKDLVQEMYIKLIDKDDEVTPFYVFKTLHSIFIDEKRKNNPYFYEIPDNLSAEEVEVEYIELPLHRLTFLEKYIVLKAMNQSRRGIARELNVNYQLINRIYNKAMAKLK